MVSEGGGQAFPWVIFSHVLRDRGGRKVFFKHVGRRAQFFSSLGPVKTERGDGHSFYWHWERESHESCAYCPKSSNSGALHSSFSTILPPFLAPT